MRNYHIHAHAILFIYNLQTFLMLNTHVLTSLSNFLQESPRNKNTSVKQVGTQFFTYVAPNSTNNYPSTLR